ncbi:MAG: folate family ECF transporter S component, partial [Firmicutes bacterium]|nr:folate family ECF transporter S component [Bacillota bacterium]
MRYILNQLSASMREFRNLRSVTTLSMLIAVALVLNLFASIQITDSLRLGFGFIATAIMGMLYGPVCAALSAGLVDILQFFLKPMGEFFPGYTLTAMLGGLLYGFFLYKKQH